MTYKAKIKELKQLKNLYVEYLKSSDHTAPQENKLIGEVARLNNQIELLESKPIAYINKTFDSWTMKKESSMNFETIIY